MLVITIFVILFIVIVGAIVYLIYEIKKNKKDDNQNSKEKERIKTTQEQLPFEYIRKNVVKQKSGVYAKVLEVPSINTQLMEPEETEIVRETYGSILNSIDPSTNSVQFYKQSRLVDIKEYMNTIDQKQKAERGNHKEEGLKHYKSFIKKLVSENSVQTKKDYLVITYVKPKNKEKESQDRMNQYKKETEEEKSNEQEEAIEKQKEFEKAFKVLSQREGTMEKQLRRLGLTTRTLQNKDLFELYYTAYNKDRSVNQSLKGVSPNDYTTMYVKRGDTNRETDEEQ